MLYETERKTEKEKGEKIIVLVIYEIHDVELVTTRQETSNMKKVKRNGIQTFPSLFRLKTTFG